MATHPILPPIHDTDKEGGNVFFRQGLVSDKGKARTVAFPVKFDNIPHSIVRVPAPAMQLASLTTLLLMSSPSLYLTSLKGTLCNKSTLINSGKQSLGKEMGHFGSLSHIVANPTPGESICQCCSLINEKFFFWLFSSQLICRDETAQIPVVLVDG